MFLNRGLGLLVQLGAFWLLLELNLEPLGLNLGALVANLRPTWALSGPTWDQLERTLGYLGRS